MSKNADKGLVAVNRRARFDYEIEETFEAGLQLVGTEVKSLREGKANIAESYVSPETGEVWLINADSPPFSHGNRNNHEPRRHRKLLLHGREIERLRSALDKDGMTLVPLKLYFNDRGVAKLELGLAKGRKTVEKRHAIKKRDWDRQKARIMREFN